MEKIPRILVINEQSMFRNNATGITMRSIFEKLPGQNIFELFWYATYTPVENKMGIRSEQIPSRYIPVNHFVRSILGYENVYATAKDGGLNFGSQIKISRKQVFKHKVKAVVEKSFLLPSRQWLKQIDDFAPTAIYTLSGSFYVNKWVLYFAKRYKCPVVIHYMDDWRATIFMQAEALKPLNRKLNKQIAAIEKHMKTGMVISDAMAEEYKKRYGYNYLAAMNTVKQMKLPEPEKGNGLHIVYAGGLHLNRYLSLLEVAEAMQAFPDMRLSVFTSKGNAEAYEKLFPWDNVTFRDPVPNDQIDTVYAQADVLLHIESFDPKVADYTKYSLSTKIAEYLASGRAIMCYAPEHIAVHQYLKDNHCGLCVASKEDLESVLEKLRDETLRLQLGACGRVMAEKNHSQTHLEEVLRKVFEYDD